MRVKVAPKAKENRIVGWMGETLKVRVTAAPEGGKANRALCRLLGQWLDVPEGRIRIRAGRSASIKLVEIEGVDQETLRR